MSKISKSLIILTAAFTLGLSTNSVVSAEECGKFSVAVVDIQKVVANSPQINALKTQQRNKITDLVSFIEQAKADVANEVDCEKKKTLEESYNKELNTKKAAIDKEYTQKMSEIDKEVSNIVKAKAKQCNYDLVLVKSSVLDGGDDITNEVIKELK